jgi:hypothetical protein
MLGPVMGLLLHQRGRFLLHASAVSLNGIAVAFLGGHASGKSTLAAALHRRGARLVADDLTAVEVEGGVPRAYPAFPQVKLWPDAVAAMGKTPARLPRVHPDVEKYACRTAGNFPRESLVLKRIYVLADGPEVTIECLSPHEGFLEIVRHWYGMRFGEHLLASAAARVAHLRRCAAVANGVAGRRLRRANRLAALGDLTRVIEADVQTEP